MKEKEIELIPGSHYLVHSLGSNKTAMKTSGVFTGYSYITKDDVGICIKMDATHSNQKGVNRIIPVTMILAIDIIKEKKANKKRDEEEATHYFM